MVSARPRRMSDVPDPPQPILPIPEGSAFFILSQSNRCDTYGQSIGKTQPKPHIHTFEPNIYQIKPKNYQFVYVPPFQSDGNPKHIYNLLLLLSIFTQQHLKFLKRKRLCRFICSLLCRFNCDVRFYRQTNPKFCALLFSFCSCKHQYCSVSKNNKSNYWLCIIYLIIYNNIIKNCR